MDIDDMTMRELRQLSDDEARENLTVEQYENWQQLVDLHEQAEDNRDTLADEQAEVAGLTVEADKEQLGTRVDVFGNDVLVYVDSEDDRFRDCADELETRFGDVGADDIPDLDADDRIALGDTLVEMLDCAIEKWGDEPWDELDEGVRWQTLEDARRKWGIDGLMLAWVDIIAAIQDDREQKMDVVEKFRGAKGRGRR